MKNKLRRICYVSGTRADFGLMKPALDAINSHPFLHLDLVVTGMHLSPLFGNTIDEINKSGLNVAAKIPTNIKETTGAEMAQNIGLIINGCVDVFQKLCPDILLVLGDRGEMIAATLAAVHLDIITVHIHGGERSGTIDEPIRHAISKLAHLHFVANLNAKQRLEKMGEEKGNIFITGAPGLDGIKDLAVLEKNILFEEVGFDPSKPTALFVFHPVLQEYEKAGKETELILDACLKENLQILAIMPNSDVGSKAIRTTLNKYQKKEKLVAFNNLERERFVSWMATCDLMIGNSSSGIIEAASFGTPVINVGSRQKFRDRNLNVIDVNPNNTDLRFEIKKALTIGRFSTTNVYGTGVASEKIANLLHTVSLHSSLTYKSNAY